MKYANFHLSISTISMETPKNSQRKQIITNKASTVQDNKSFNRIFLKIVNYISKLVLFSNPLVVSMDGYVS